MYDGTKAISDFEEIMESEIGGEQPGQFEDDDIGDLGLGFNKDNFASPNNGKIQNVNINDIDLEEFNPSTLMGLVKNNVREKAKNSKNTSQKDGGSIKSKKNVGDNTDILSDQSRSRSRKKVKKEKEKKTKKKSKYDDSQESWSD